MRVVDILANAVSLRSPKGRMLCWIRVTAPTITKDGVTVAKEIAVLRTVRNRAQSVKRASRPPTSLVTAQPPRPVLAQAIVTEV